jgi:predicted glycoside hydrolase/deacetylase ChbG (UPF0249 family)
MKKLIINADDFGYREGVNKGIVYAYQNGVVSSASLFVEREGTDEAVRLARENPGLGLGLHLDLDGFFDVDHHQGVVLGWATPQPDLEAVRREARRQIDKYSSFGFTADHLDSHHHAHLHPEVFPLVCALAQEYRIPVVRYVQKVLPESQPPELMKNVLARYNRKYVDHFIEGWYWGNVDENYQVAELMTHPGYGELWREAELAHCCQPQLKQYFKDQKIDLLRFSDIFPAE